MHFDEGGAARPGALCGNSGCRCCQLRLALGPLRDGGFATTVSLIWHCGLAHTVAVTRHGWLDSATLQTPQYKTKCFGRNATKTNCVCGANLTCPEAHIVMYIVTSLRRYFVTPLRLEGGHVLDADFSKIHVFSNHFCMS